MSWQWPPKSRSEVQLEEVGPDHCGNATDCLAKRPSVQKGVEVEIKAEGDKFTIHLQVMLIG